MPTDLIPPRADSLGNVLMFPGCSPIVLAESRRKALLSIATPTFVPVKPDSCKLAIKFIAITLGALVITAVSLTLWFPVLSINLARYTPSINGSVAAIVVPAIVPLM